MTDLNDLRKPVKPKPAPQDDAEQVLGREPLRPTPLKSETDNKKQHD
ncbi:MAG: hypothetical protein ACOY5F_04780 [Pseudomonadota bacterium]